MRLENGCYYRLGSGELVAANRTAAGKFALINTRGETVDTINADVEVYHAQQLSMKEWETEVSNIAKANSGAEQTIPKSIPAKESQKSKKTEA